MQAVLTGTLTGPATERSADFSLAALAEAAGELIAWGMANPRFMRFRGTSWQMYLSDGSRALRVSLFLAACLRAAETGMGTCVAAAVGAVERLDDNLGRAAGPAFDASGQALDRMPRGRWLRVVAAGPDPWAGASEALVDWIAARWSREQAEALALALDPAAPPQGDIAARLGVTRQAVQARLSAAGLPALLPALAAFEAAETVGITLPSP
jgi:hypothetical protein